MKHYVLIVSLFVLAALAACAPVPTDPGRTIETSPGKTFQIVIDSNPTTGYHWEIVGELDKNVIEFVSKEYQSTSAPGMVGGGGLDTWTFKAIAVGEAEITLGSYPPSDTDADPAQTQVFHVSVK
jgi:inhibitor of cysteine peptidase